MSVVIATDDQHNPSVLLLLKWSISFHLYYFQAFSDSLIWISMEFTYTSEHNSHLPEVLNPGLWTL